MEVEVLLAIPFGLAIGAVFGTVGGGGAILALPLLVYLLGEGVSPASTASLVVVSVAASVGAGAQARDGQVCCWVVASFAAPAAPGAYLDALASASVSARALILAFVPVMLIAAVLTYFRGDSSHDSDQGGCPKVSVARAGGSGLIVGAMTGFFGVGGRFLIVPALTTVLGLAMRRAIATSLAIVTFTGVAALVRSMRSTARAAPDTSRSASSPCGAASV